MPFGAALFVPSVMGGFFNVVKGVLSVEQLKKFGLSVWRITKKALWCVAVTFGWVFSKLSYMFDKAAEALKE